MLTTMWEVDYIQHREQEIQEYELGARVEELDGCEESTAIQQDDAVTSALMAGPELPLPRPKAGALHHGTIDMSKMAEEVELELDQELKGGKHGQ
jgi:hypothetical protein